MNFHTRFRNDKKRIQLKELQNEWLVKKEAIKHLKESLAANVEHNKSHVITNDDMDEFEELLTETDDDDVDDIGELIFYCDLDMLVMRKLIRIFHVSEWTIISKNAYNIVIRLRLSTSHHCSCHLMCEFTKHELK